MIQWDFRQLKMQEKFESPAPFCLFLAIPHLLERYTYDAGAI